MGETSEDPSIAAQRAQEELEDEDSADKPGLLGWLFGRAPEQAAEPEPEDPQKQYLEASAAGAQAMLVNVRKLRDLRVDDVAIPKADIAAIAANATLDEVVTAFRDSTYTRLPVYEETLDHPIGLVHLKDIALRYGFGAGEDAFDLSENVRPLIYVPPSMPIGALLQKMQSERMHMALVIDEYGGVDGLITIEDLIEQIVGEIADEHDAEEAAYFTESAPGEYLALARTPLAEFEQATGVDLNADESDEDVDTLGGLVFMLAGYIPARGEIVRTGSGHEFEVVDADARRIKRLRVRTHGAPAKDKRAAE